MNRKTVLETERLVLEPLAMKHAPEIVAMLEDGRVADTASSIPHPYTIADAEWFVGHVGGEEAPPIVRAMVRRTDGAVLGCIGVEPRAGNEAELGYWLGEEHWGNGFATEAARAVVADAFDRLGFVEVRAGVYPRNPPSQRVLLKCGLEPLPVGVHPGTVETIRGGVEAIEWFAIRREVYYERSPKPGRRPLDMTVHASPMIDFTPTNELGKRVLFTPGPVTTSPAVRIAATLDVGSWDADTTNAVRNCQRILKSVCGDRGDIEVTLIPGSGTYAVESMLGSAVPEGGLVVILSNGLYGDRLCSIAEHIGLRFVKVESPEHQQNSPEALAKALAAHPDATHVATCHVETTAGVLNDLSAIGAVCNEHGVRLLVDAMASFCGYPVGPGEAIDFDAAPIDHIVASANKCAQGLPGMSYVVSRASAMDASKMAKRSMSLDLFAQWKLMSETGRFRYTPPTHVLLALERALIELEEETVPARVERFQANQALTIERMAQLGFETYLDPAVRSHINTTFRYPTPDFDFEAFKDGLKQRGYIIFPQKVTQADTVRVGAIGHIGAAEIMGFTEAVAQVMGRSF